MRAGRSLIIARVEAVRRAPVKPSGLRIAVPLRYRARADKGPRVAADQNSDDKGGASPPDGHGAKRARKPRKTRAASADAAPQEAPRSGWRMWLLLRWRTLLRRLVFAALALAALPLLLTLLYALPFVRPVSTLMLWDIAALQGYTREWRAIDDISPNLKTSVLMSEDGQFCSHHGVDVRELRGVVEDALDGEATRGASTITMQLAKNLFLWNGRSFLRKALELPLAVWIDLVMPKRRIMEIYLNIAEWGPDNLYGIGAASAAHFGVDASSMSRRQAALLTVTLPNPVARNPAKPSRGMLDVARVVERRARNGGPFAACILPQG
jgi:monofunctional biosynthetic peptidoglycan transglycosylase